MFDAIGANALAAACPLTEVDPPVPPKTINSFGDFELRHCRANAERIADERDSIRDVLSPGGAKKNCTK